MTYSESADRMHILYLITRAEMGGSQTHLLDLLEGFSKEHQLTLVTGEEGFLTEEAQKLGVPTFVLPHLVHPIRPQKDVQAVFDLLALIRARQPDLVHCHTSKAGILGRIAASIARVPAVFTAHTWAFAEGTSLKWKLVGLPAERLAARATTTILAVSESNRRLAITNGVAPAGKIVTVHNGICDTGFRARPDRGGVPRVTMVARFAPQKNQTALVEAVAALGEPCRLTFVGDGPTRPAVEELAARLGLKQVEFLGLRSDTAEILADSDIFALATNWEGFPITILEAMRAGLPVLATDVDGVSEAVIDGATGILLPKGDNAALELGLRRLLAGAELRREMGQAGRMRYEEHFTRSRMLDKINSIYNKAVYSSERSEPALQSA